ncbi:glutathione hydrolase proenzyme [Rhipicephalus microplus]|uniref:glutathione hydrolase proenzyme n=1 Tax=Rhipicephalus microplus TaxID=6941 RepID=UPI003F6C2F0D
MIWWPAWPAWRIAAEGPRAIYEGSVAECMIEAVHSASGVLSTKDLSDHRASPEPMQVEPVKTTYHGNVTVHTTPLPTHGAVMLEALNILEGFDLAALQELPGQFQHVMVEALRHATADGMRYVGAPEDKAAITKMLSRERARDCAASVKLDRVKRTFSIWSRKIKEVCPDIGRPQKRTGTTFLAAADGAGNVCTFTGSLARNFGCAVVEQHDFAIQARGNEFNNIAGHPNCVGPRKKPYHTLMPVVVTDARTKDWLCTLGAMGGAMQPNIFFQGLLNMLELGLDPQQSVSKARVLFGSMFSVHPE